MSAAVDTHVTHVCTCDRPACMFCDGGLFACDVCNAFEGATPDDCPGRPMAEEESEAVYRGELNYRDGAWREECCAIMRPTYDRDAYMAEHGYASCGFGHWNPVGERCRWEHLHEGATA